VGAGCCVRLIALRRSLLKLGLSLVACAACSVACAGLLGIDDAGYQGLDAAADAPASIDAPSNADASSRGYAGEVMADRPLVYLRLDERSGAVAADSSGNHHDATIDGTVIWGVTGATSDGDTALRLDGVSSSLTLGSDVADFSDVAPFTLEAWVFEDATDDTFRMLFAKDSYPASGREEYGVYYQSGFIAFERWVKNAPVKVAMSRPDILKAWHHVVSVYDGARLVCYVDAIPLGPVAVDARSQLPKDGKLFIGAKDLGTGTIRGALDEVAIYDKALAYGRVQAHAAAAHP
jgi:Concanavalin A-like lectin/glucanases superfamily